MIEPEMDPYAIPDDYPGCRGCAHWRDARCVAFPKRIPFMLISGQIHHLRPLPGQEGDTVFEPLAWEWWVKTRERRVLAEPEPAEAR